LGTFFALIHANQKANGFLPYFCPATETLYIETMMQNRSYNTMQMPPVTQNLILINALCWLASLVLPRFGIDLIELGGLHFPGTNSFHWFQPLTYMFLHDTRSIGHLFFNMFAVFMFGRVLEATWGPRRFLVFYLVTGVGAALVQELTWLYTIRDYAVQNNFSIMQQVALDPGVSMLVTIGASGAVFGVLLAFGMLFPDAPLYVMFVPIPIKAKYFVVIYGLIELFMGVANFTNDNVAHFAHLGGMLFGLILILYWRKKDRGDERISY